LEVFQKPQCDPKDLSNVAIEDVVKDIHRALYGNGGATRGIIWKLAEQAVFSMDLLNKQQKCRTQVVDHFEAIRKEAIERDRGVIAFCRRYKKFSIMISVIVFFGISSLWSIIMQERQTTKIESLVLGAVSRQFRIFELTRTPVK